VHRALDARKDRGVNLVSVFLPAEDDSATGATEGLVRSEGDKVRIRDRGGIRPTSYEAREMGHISQKIGANLVCNLAKFGEIEEAKASAVAAPGSARRVELYLVASREMSPGKIASYGVDYPYWAFMEQ